MGNGDPTSLENEKFIDEIQAMAIQDLKEKELPGMDKGQEALTEQGNSWQEAFKGRNYKNLAAAYIHRGSFELPENFQASQVTFFYKSIGKEQSIYINGKEIASDVKESAEGSEFKLDHAWLKPDKNRIDIIATPIPKKREWDHVNTDPGTIQIVTPAHAWKRKLFNGLAQIIVQSTKEADEITLIASSSGLKTTVLKLNAASTASRPSID